MEGIKEQKQYKLTLADVTVGCSFEFPETHLYFGRYASGPFEGEGIRLSPEDRARWEEKIAPMDAYNEYSAFTLPAAEALMLQSRFIVHAAAFSFRGRAYLIAAPSGVGKSTQVRTLTELYPGEFTVISGDRPILEAAEDGIVVHPSPWNGKEGWCGADKAPLAAVILLRRGDENRIERLSARKAAARVFSAVFQDAETEDDVRLAAHYTERMLETVSVWDFVNAGVPDSTKLLYEEVLSKENEDGV